MTKPKILTVGSRIKGFPSFGGSFNVINQSRAPEKTRFMFTSARGKKKKKTECKYNIIVKKKKLIFSSDWIWHTSLHFLLHSVYYILFLLILLEIISIHEAIHFKISEVCCKYVIGLLINQRSEKALCSEKICFQAHINFSTEIRRYINKF